MTIELNEDINSYINGFETYKEELITNNLDWLDKLKSSALKSFSTQGFPKLTDEDWRFTNIAPISKGKFHIEENGHRELSKKELNKILFKSLECYRLVFINGYFSEKESDISDLPHGVIIESLNKGITENEEIVMNHIGKYADFSIDSFIALNTAFFQDGVFIYVPKSTVLKKPIHIIYYTTEDGSTFVNPRNLIICENNSEVKVIEHYYSASDHTYLSNVVTELVLGENSNVEHYMIELESKKAFNISTLRVQQKRNSNIRSHSILIGGSIVRNNVHPVLAGEGCNSLINGLFIAKGRQHMDNFMRVEHVSPHCDSRQLYNGILDNRSRGVFHGRIIVHEGAEKTDAKQTNRNLLLSDTAQIDTKPQLEIYNDDVKCTHGATIGQMDEGALFYLRSRGIPKKEAQAIMLQAFTFETLSNMTLEPIKDNLHKTIVDWFGNRD